MLLTSSSLPFNNASTVSPSCKPSKSCSSVSRESPTYTRQPLPILALGQPPAPPWWSLIDRRSSSEQTPPEPLRAIVLQAHSNPKNARHQERRCEVSCSSEGAVPCPAPPSPSRGLLAAPVQALARAHAALARR